MASTYLSRTPSSTTNRKTFTISTWVKLSTTSGAKSISHAGTTGGNYTLFDFDTPNTIRAIWASGGSGVVNVVSNAVHRDTNGWYHIVFSVDTTQATASNRIKIYVNGEQITSFSSSTYPSQNFDTFHNSTSYANNIGKYITTGGSDANFFDGSMAHYHFIDGTAYNASAFGETDATTGIWKPKTAPSVTYGTNGFFLKFENSGSMGTDSSGNGNNLTVNGTMTQTVDTPSNVFATFNPLYNINTFNGNLSNGNLTAASSASYKGTILSTLGASQGKWYWEVKCDSGGQNGIGISNDEISLNAWSPTSGNYVIWHYGGDIRRPSGVTASGTSYTAGDIIGVAWNADDAEVTFYKNGTAINSGTAYSVEGTQGTMFASLSDVNTGDAPTASINFGNGYFGTTAVSSAQNPSDGIGIFEYTVPTGYKALCTKSINAQEYS